MSRCLSTLQPLAAEGFSPAARRRLAEGRAIDHHVDIVRADVPRLRVEAADHMSISGVQDKISLRLHRGRLLTTETGGTHILKPIPSTVLPRLHPDIVANEHLTMQLAEQVFGIRTAANGCVRLADGELAYLTRRFDRQSDGSKVAQEDFCQVMGRSEQTHGKNRYKYDSSYQALGAALKNVCAAYAVEVEELFRRIVFCYATCNGDAHLKNFSVGQTPAGDYVLTPAYDLLNTTVHLPGEARLALELLDEDFTQGERTAGFVTGADLLELAARFGMRKPRAEAILAAFPQSRDKVHAMVEASVLTDEAKGLYVELFDDRLVALGK